MILVNPNTSQALHDESIALIRQNRVGQILIVGGSNAVPDATMTKITNETRFQGTMRRLSGLSRYDTSIAVNNYLADSGVGKRKTVWVAYGGNFPDALSAAVPASKPGNALVLSLKTCLTKPVTSSWINGPSSGITQAKFVGGTQVLGPNVTSLRECTP